MKLYAFNQLFEVTVDPTGMVEQLPPLGTAAVQKLLQHIPISQFPVHPQNFGKTSGSAVLQEAVTVAVTEFGGGIKNQIVFDGCIDRSDIHIVPELLFFLRRKLFFSVTFKTAQRQNTVAVALIVIVLNNGHDRFAFDLIHQLVVSVVQHP